MPHCVLATTDDSLRSRVLDHLAHRGLAAASCTTWDDLIGVVARASTRVVALDAALPGADGALLAAVVASLQNPPVVRVLQGALPPLPVLDSLDALAEVVRRSAPPVLSEWERSLLDRFGLGGDPVPLLRRLAASPHPVRIQGERGLGKESVARWIHRLRDPSGPFVILRPRDEALLEQRPGTLYLENLDQHPPADVLTAMTRAGEQGWRLLAGSRRDPEPEREGLGWTHLSIRPLRERPRDLRPLARLYLDRYTAKLGLPRRRISARLWALMERYPWPSNHRELETFVVQAVTSARGATLSPSGLPPRVLAMLDPTARLIEQTAAFERVVEERLRPVVTRYEPGDDAPRLHRLVLDATERALVRLALTRTGGNQKAAAELLGVARNTLRARIDRLDPWREEP